jgi:hypothetical protein
VWWQADESGRMAAYPYRSGKRRQLVTDRAAAKGAARQLGGMIGFKNLVDYESCREKPVADPEAKENVDFARRSGCVLIEDRS